MQIPSTTLRARLLPDRHIEAGNRVHACQGDVQPTPSTMLVVRGALLGITRDELLDMGADELTDLAENAGHECGAPPRIAGTRELHPQSVAGCPGQRVRKSRYI